MRLSDIFILKLQHDVHSGLRIGNKSSTSIPTCRDFLIIRIWQT